MRIILLGPPGAGKGTQAEFLCANFKIPRISTGDLLRQEIAARSPIGQMVKDMMAEGKLVPEDIVIKMLKDRISQPDCKNGFLLDGFPRTVHQAEILENEGLKIDAIIEISVPDEEIVSRLSGRRFHEASGRSYHVSLNPPKEPDRDDITREPLICREDDKAESVRRRLEVYHQHTKPLISWYKGRPGYRYITIKGQGPIKDIQRSILESLNQEENAKVKGR